MSDLDRQRWDARYREDDAGDNNPTSFLAEIAELLPANGRALDVAGGAGRNAVWLAERGLDVTLVDVSPEGLARARARAREHGVEICARELDLEQESLPAGPWSVVTLLYYLQRDLYARVADILAPGGLLLVAHATRTNLERHTRPPAHYILEDGELPSLIRDLEIVRYEEGWFAEGRHEARLAARLPGLPGLPGSLSR